MFSSAWAIFAWSRGRALGSDYLVDGLGRDRVAKHVAGAIDVGFEEVVIGEPRSAASNPGDGHASTVRNRRSSTWTPHKAATLSTSEASTLRELVQHEQHVLQSGRDAACGSELDRGGDLFGQERVATASLMHLIGRGHARLLAEDLGQHVPHAVAVRARSSSSMTSVSGSRSISARKGRTGCQRVSSSVRYVPTTRSGM